MRAIWNSAITRRRSFATTFGEANPTSPLMNAQLHLRLALLSFAFLTPLSVYSATQNAFYLSPQGEDSNSGSFERPFKTPEAARDAVRALKSSQGLPSGGVYIFFRTGTYEFSKSFDLDDRDSGSADRKISYQAYPSEKVVISGGNFLDRTKFEPVSDPSILTRLPAASVTHVLQYNLKAAGRERYGDYHTKAPHGVEEVPYEPATELYVGGKAMPIARFPNEGWIKVGRVIDRGAISKEDGFAKVLDTSNRGGCFEFDIPQASRWSQAQDIWLSGWFFWGWFYDEVKVAKLDLDQKQFKLASALRYGLAPAPDDSRTDGGNSKRRRSEEIRKYYVFNLLEEIDQPGEWYLDRRTGVLYLWPTEEFYKEEIAVTVLNSPLIRGEKASFVDFEGLELCYGKQQGIVLRNSVSNRIAGCSFRNLGSNALTISGRHQEVLSCNIHHTKGGINASGGDRRHLSAADISIINCDIHHFTDRAIELNGVGIKVAHNEIHDAEGSAIGFSGNNHLIAFNRFTHLYNAGGDDLNIVGIGRNPSDHGSQIRFNLFAHIGLAPNNVYSVYLDDGSCGTTVYGNIFYQASSGHLGATYSNGGSDNSFINNVYIDNEVAYWLGNCFHTWAKARIKDYLSPTGDFTVKLTQEVNIKDPSWISAYPNLAKYFEDDPATPKRNVFSRNVVIHSKTAVKGDATEINVQEVNKSLRQENFIADAMPGLLDLPQRKFDPEKLEEIFKSLPNFEALPVEKIGNYKDQFRN